MKIALTVCATALTSVLIFAVLTLLPSVNAAAENLSNLSEPNVIIQAVDCAEKPKIIGPGVPRLLIGEESW